MFFNSNDMCADWNGSNEHHHPAPNPPQRAINNSNPVMLHAMSFEGGGGGGKSTRGASKMRRDLINSEIANLRDLLPLPSSTRQRLSQLQLMALVLVYVRKSNYFDQVFKMIGREHPARMEMPSFGFSKALNGFLMMATQTGKLLYISDNAAEYLGHSMEDLLIHGDSVYDIIDKQDHASIQSELMRGLQAGIGTEHPTSPSSSMENANEKRIFLCRMNVSRNARRQMRFGDQKVVLIEGKFSGVLPLCSRNEPVFLSWCTPIAMPETRECVVQGATNIFTSIHSMDFKITTIDSNGEYYLGYKKFDLKGVSWYNLLHPDCLKEVQNKHRLITQSENDRSCILLLRLQKQDGTWVWVHTVLQVKENLEHSQSPVIVCTNQVLSEREALVMKANSWLYHYYMVQSRLQYSLAYGGQSPNALAAAFYPGMQGSPGAGFAPQSAFDGHMLHPSAFMASPQTSVSHYGYGYTPPPGAYNLHQHYHHHQQDHSHHQRGNGVAHDRCSESPLDFSAAAAASGSSTGNSQFGAWHDEDHLMRGYDDNAKVVGFNDLATNGDRTSSPEYRSETSSTSPLQMTLLDSGGGGGGGEVSTLSRQRYHRAGTNNNGKQKQLPTTINIQSNSMGLTNHQQQQQQHHHEAYTASTNVTNNMNAANTVYTSLDSSVQRVPEIQRSNNTTTTANVNSSAVDDDDGCHELKKWSEVSSFRRLSPKENGEADLTNGYKRPSPEPTQSNTGGDTNNNHTDNPIVSGINFSQ